MSAKRSPRAATDAPRDARGETVHRDGARRRRGSYVEVLENPKGSFFCAASSPLQKNIVLKTLGDVIAFNDEEHPVVTTRFPACEDCARLWADDDREAVGRMDRVASEWAAMDALLKEVKADGIA